MPKTKKRKGSGLRLKLDPAKIAEAQLALAQKFVSEDNARKERERLTGKRERLPERFAGRQGTKETATIRQLMRDLQSGSGLKKRKRASNKK